MVASPVAGAPGDRVSITGEGFTAENWQAPNAPLYLKGGPTRCDFIATAVSDIHVTAAGRLTGSFIVPARGDCRMSLVGGIPVVAGHYSIVYQCTACAIGEFDVTVDAPTTKATCPNVGFTPNSDNVASNIVAYNLSCDDAVALVRKVGAAFGPVNGAARGEADDFTCVRTGQRDGPGLPSATYECTRVTQRITFTRA